MATTRRSATTTRGTARRNTRTRRGGSSGTGSGADVFPLASNGEMRPADGTGSGSDAFPLTGVRRAYSPGRGSGADPFPLARVETTGKYLVLMREGAVSAGVKALRDKAGIRAAHTADFDKGAVDAKTLATTEALVFDKLAVAVVDAPPEQIQTLQTTAAEGDVILAVEPERVVYALESRIGLWSEEDDRTMTLPGTELPVQYLHGYRDAVNHLIDRLLVEGQAREDEVAVAVKNEAVSTWGLQVTKVTASQFSGQGIRLAVLDTGLDLQHPDFAARQLTARSFVRDRQGQDGHGHGTHCIGTACGPQQPRQLPRYGIAYGAEIFAGKVLTDQGRGTDKSILAGINWAITNECQIISMSLGASIIAGQTFSRIFQQVAERGLKAGTLIIAAAGNDSERPGFIAPVAHPANCPAIMAVAAVDKRIRVASFSNGGLYPQGGQVDIAGPGVDVQSAWPRPMLYRTISGTSMATPHVAGVAALHAEANPHARGDTLWRLLIQTARRSSLPARDVGAGLVQAP
jgi:subtilisin family serine protease